VKHGENPSSIARRYRLTVERLLGANPGLRPAKLQIGQVLKIPAQ
jgi:LysM repeat protein